MQNVFFYCFCSLVVIPVPNETRAFADHLPYQEGMRELQDEYAVPFHIPAPAGYEDKTNEAAASEKANRISQLPSSRKKWALGIGANIPDLLPIEAYWLASPSLSLRTFVAMPLPFTVRVEYERSVLARRGGLAIENPDLTVDFAGTYGPQFGLETLYHPFQSNFYLGMGMSYRQLKLLGSLLSELILTSSAGSVDTNSLISLKTKGETRQYVYRASLGWMWFFREGRSYINLTVFGITIPERAKSEVSMQAKILNPNAKIEVKNEVIEEAEQRFADDLSRKARKTIRPVERLQLPIIGLSGGISF